MNESLLDSSLLVLGTPRKTQPVQMFTPKGVKPKLIQKSDTVQVFVRLKPENTISDQPIPVEVVDKNTIRCEKGSTNRCFPFNEVFDENTSQKELYENTSQGCVTNLFSCIKSLIFAYGVTGTGKTFTMIGEYDESKGTDNHGIILRLLEDAVVELEKRRKEDPHLCLYANFIEHSYNGTPDGKCTDLLEGYDPLQAKKGPRDSMISSYSNCSYSSVRSTASTKSKPQKIKIHQNGESFLAEGMLDVEVNSAGDAFDIISYGSGKRKIRSTKLNSDSSRSHAIFYLNLGRRSLKNNNLEYDLLNRITVVDLAGSERHKDIAGQDLSTREQHDQKEMFKESIFINSSLTNFSTTIQQLKQTGTSTHIRNSALTKLVVSNDFGKFGCKIVAILTLTRLPERLNETFTTLTFSTNLLGVKTIDLTDGRTVNQPPPTFENPELKIAMDELKAEKIARQEDEFKIRELVLREAEFSLQMRDTVSHQELMNIKQQLQNKIDVARKETQLYFQKYEQAITHKEYYKNKLSTFQSKIEDQNLIIGKLQIERDEYREKFESVKCETENGSLISEKYIMELDSANQQLQSIRKEKDNNEKIFYSRTQQYESEKRGLIDKYEQEKRNIIDQARKEIESLRTKLQESDVKTEKQREYIRLLKEKTVQLIQAQQEEKKEKESSSILSKFSSMFSSKQSKQSKEEDCLQPPVVEQSSELKRKHDLKEDDRSKVESPKKKAKVEEIAVEKEESDVIPTKKRTVKRKFISKK